MIFPVSQELFEVTYRHLCLRRVYGQKECAVQGEQPIPEFQSKMIHLHWYSYWTLHLKAKFILLSEALTMPVIKTKATKLFVPSKDVFILDSKCELMNAWMTSLVKTKVSPYFDEKLVNICPVLEISKRVENTFLKTKQHHIIWPNLIKPNPNSSLQCVLKSPSPHCKVFSKVHLLIATCFQKSVSSF